MVPFVSFGSSDGKPTAIGLRSCAGVVYRGYRLPSCTGSKWMYKLWGSSPDVAPSWRGRNIDRMDVVTRDLYQNGDICAKIK